MLAFLVSVGVLGRILEKCTASLYCAPITIIRDDRTDLPRAATVSRVVLL